jgi:hypothetical protein
MDERSRETRNERIPAVVFGCLLPGELRIILHPGAGVADGGVPLNVAIDGIPAGLRLPNTELWVHLDEKRRLVRAWRRSSGE